MKTFKKALLLLLFVTMFSTSSLNIYASNNDKEDSEKPIIYGMTATVRNCKNVNIREEPSASSKVVKTIPFETEFTIVDQTGKWFQIEYEDISGYIYWKYVGFIEPEIEEDSTLIGNSIINYTSSENRDINMSIACELIDWTILDSNESFKWSLVVGQTTSEKGFKSAPVIINRRVTSGLGGGVCQVSSTLYNATMDTSLKIVERHHHSLGCAYTKNDATVAQGYKDFIFKNTYDFPIQIEAFSYKSVVFVNIYRLDSSKKESSIR